jgi:hypothetical protein
VEALRAGPGRGDPESARSRALQAAFEGPEDEQRRRFRCVYLELDRRIDLFTNPPVESLDRMSVKARLDEIGKTLPPAGDER